VRSGLVVVDKPAGWTSHDVVAKLRRAYGQRRIGHAGTLDPDATGVLLVGLGRVTRLLRFLQDAGKSYRATIGFGIATDTLDASGEVVERRELPITRAQLDEAAREFTGEIEQVPPMVSALKVGGRKLYELARRGEEIERKARRVRVDALVVEEFRGGPFPEAVVRVDCSSGTYVRSLAADLGAALGGPAHLRGLRRTRVGSFTLDEARPLDAIVADPEVALLPPAAAVRDLPRATVDAAHARAVLHGRPLGDDDLDLGRAVAAAVASGGPFAVFDDGGGLLAVYEPAAGGGAKPAVVVAGELVP
jgi:tRNA pseudouridine55 synthase